MKKKFLTVLLCAVFCCLLCAAAMAANENYFDADIRTETSANGTVVLTISDSPVLSEKAPKLNIPFTETANVHVFHDGAELECTANGIVVSFAVSEGGQYIIAADSAPRIREVEPDCTQDGYYVYSLNGESFTEPSGNYSTGHWYGKNGPVCLVCGEANPRYVAPEEGYVTCPGDDTCVMEKYTDVDANEWYHDGLHYCIEHGIMNGVSDDRFDPDGEITRAMIVTMLWRLDGEKLSDSAMAFADVPEDEWYTEAVRWVSSEGIVLGYDDGSFGADDPITREQLATILYRYAQYKGQGFTGDWMFPLDFVDTADIDEWANEAIHWCSMKSIVSGKEGKLFDPLGNATRAEAAAMMQRFCEALEK